MKRLLGWEGLGALLATVPPSARQLASRRYWLVAVVPLAWPLLLYALLFVGDGGGGYTQRAVQGLLIGLPLAALGIFLGVRVIAAEIDQRTLEIAYTVPGGASRIWTAKLIAAGLLMLAAELTLAGAVFLLLTSFSFESLAASLEVGLFFLVLATGSGALFRGTISGALAATVVLGVALVFAGSPYSPFWSPTLVPELDPAQLQALWLRNRLGYLLLGAAVLALAYSRAERRERMLGGA